LPLDPPGTWIERQGGAGPRKQYAICDRVNSNPRPRPLIAQPGPQTFRYGLFGAPIAFGVGQGAERMVDDEIGHAERVAPHQGLMADATETEKSVAVALSPPRRWQTFARSLRNGEARP
jgi:hypothetical protein